MNDASPREYQAPALEKGLDVMEFLADQRTPLGMMSIANALGRSRNEIYRTLVVLTRRGYLERLSDDRFELSSRLFELGMRTPPRRNLLDAALPVMHELADSLLQSCHLAVRSGDDMVVVARVESPGMLGFSVRIGYRRPIALSTTGRLLHAFMPAKQQEEWLAAAQTHPEVHGELDRFLADSDRVRLKGVHIGPSAFVDAITDLGAPIFDGVSEGAVAGLVIPFVSGRSARSTMDEAITALRAAGDRISDAMRHG